MTGRNKVYIAIGSNQGDKEVNLQSALKALSAFGEVKRVSSFIVTKPVGYENQEYFLNGALEFNTSLSPEALLEALKKTEAALGRKPTFKNGPRVIDLDIIFYEDLVLNTPTLTIPHPRMHERYFVLKPLSLIAPNFVHPVLKKDVCTLRSELK